MSKYFFLDTNIYLHYQLFTQINWSEVLEDARPILVVPITIIHEIENKKYIRTDDKLRARAKQVSDLFGKIIRKQSVPFASGLEVKFLYKEPTVDWLEFALDKENADDRFLAEVIQFASDNPDDEIVVVSGDNGVVLKASVRGIQNASLDDSYLMTFDDPKDKKIKELERQVAKYKSTFPDVSLVFADGGSFSSKSIKTLAQYSKRQLKAALAAYTKEHFIDANDPMKAMLGGMRAYDTQDVERYLEDWKKHIAAYEEYLLLLREYGIRKRLLVELSLTLRNTGFAPAEDLDVFIKIPDGVQAVLLPDLEMAPAEPKLPKEPRTLMMMTSVYQMLEQAGELGRMDREWLYPGYSSGRQGTSLRIRKGEIHYKRELLKHGLSYTLDKFYLAFPSFDAVDNLSLEYKILVGNTPEPKIGSLGLKVAVEA